MASRASEWAALVASTTSSMESMEAEQPPGLTLEAVTLTVTRTGGLNVSGPTSTDLLAVDAVRIRDWLTSTFDSPPP